MNQSDKIFELNFTEEGEALFNSLRNPVLSVKMQRIIGASSLLFALLTFVIIALLSYRYTAKGIDFVDIKIIKAETTPLKIIPEEPTGVQFRNQDKLIYETIEHRTKKLKKATNKNETVKAKKNNPASANRNSKKSDIFSLLSKE